MTVRILEGDCRDILKTLPDASVQMCVTSPPYFGLRDYGTAQWEGGDSACDHIAQRKPATLESSSTLGVPADGGRRRMGAENTYHEAYTAQYRDTCGKCGARRIDQQIGLEPSVDAYVAELVSVFREVRRVLRPDGTLWCNLGDSFADKQLLGVPWRVAFALQADGWWLRSEIIWAKPNPMPESVRDRPTKSHEQIFLLSKQPRYYFDAEAVREPHTGEAQRAVERGSRVPAKTSPKVNPSLPNGQAQQFKQSHSNYFDQDGNLLINPAGRNIRSVWTIATAPFSEAHFATFPPDLVIPCIKAGTSERGACPACGSPWVRVVERGESSWEARKTEGDPIRYGLNGTASATSKRSFADDAHRAAGGLGVPAVHQTTGWQPSCTCDAGDPAPCTVLDPFAGAGTAGLVADRLGRDAILIELNAEYAAMARRRITGDAPLFASVT